jgi:putative membrane protein
VEGATKKPNLVLCVLVFVFFFALIIGMQFMGEGTDRVVTPSLANALILLVMGVLAAAAMVIPGVSGSLLLLAFGYYNVITGAVTDFISAVFDLDIATAWDRALILFPFGIGVLLGIFFVAKLIEWLLAKHERLTYCGILGLVCASPIPVFMNALGGKIGVVAIIASVVTFIAGFVVAYVMGRE